jgi:hypothetical protein
MWRVEHLLNLVGTKHAAICLEQAPAGHVCSLGDGISRYHPFKCFRELGSDYLTKVLDFDDSGNELAINL